MIRYKAFDIIFEQRNNHSWLPIQGYVKLEKTRLNKKQRFGMVDSAQSLNSLELLSLILEDLVIF